jgi:ABC-type sugar transport system substrate-binding protein
VTTHSHGPEQSGLSRRRLLSGAATAAALGGLAACGGSSDDTRSEGSPARTAGNGEKRKVIWALAAIAEWNLAVDVGFIEATRMLGWDYQKVGLPISQYSPENVVNVVNRAAAARPDVLVTPAWVPGVAAAAEAAQKAGVLVLFNNANNIPDDAVRLGIPYIGADELTGGQSLGTPFAESLAKAGRRSGTIVAGLAFAGNENLEARARGATETIEDYNGANGTDFRVERFIDKSGEGAEQALTAYKTKMRQMGDELVGFLLPGGDAALAGLLPALREAGLAPGELPVATWDVSQRSTKALAEGWVVAIVDKQDYVTGFLPVFQAWAQLERGFVARDYDTGGVLVDESNVAVARRREEQIAAKAEEFDVRLS